MSASGRIISTSISPIIQTSATWISPYSFQNFCFNRIHNAAFLSIWNLSLFSARNCCKLLAFLQPKDGKCLSSANFHFCHTLAHNIVCLGQKTNCQCLTFAKPPVFIKNSASITKSYRETETARRVYCSPLLKFRLCCFMYYHRSNVVSESRVSSHPTNSPLTRTLSFGTSSSVISFQSSPLILTAK